MLEAEEELGGVISGASNFSPYYMIERVILDMIETGQVKMSGKLQVLLNDTLEVLDESCVFGSEAPILKAMISSNMEYPTRSFGIRQLRPSDERRYQDLAREFRLTLGKQYRQPKVI